MAQPVLFDLSNLYSPSTENKNVTIEDKKPMPKKCECTGCNKKLMISDLKCKCNKYYCSMHRFATDHQCGYDYKSDGNKILEKQLVKICANKIEKI